MKENRSLFHKKINGLIESVTSTTVPQKYIHMTLTPEPQMLTFIKYVLRKE